MKSNPVQKYIDERMAWSLMGQRLVVLFMCGAALALSLDLAGFAKSGFDFAVGAVFGLGLQFIADTALRAKVLQQVPGPISLAYKAVSSLGVLCGLLAGWNMVEATMLPFAASWVPAAAGFVLGATGGVLANQSKNPTPTLEVENTVENDLEVPSHIGQLSPEKLELAVVHEAGHAAALAIYPARVLDICFVTIESGQIFTATPIMSDDMTNSVMLRAEMFVFLAGPVASNRYFGGFMEGAGNDFTQWRRRACAVLAAEAVEGWVHDPETELEFNSNEKLLHALKEEQIEAVNSFFDTNDAPYRELVDHLMEHRSASSEDLKRILAPAKFCQKTLQTLKLA